MTASGEKRLASIALGLAADWGVAHHVGSEDIAHGDSWNAQLLSRIVCWTAALHEGWEEKDEL
jgi:hypothetical protein